MYSDRFAPCAGHNTPHRACCDESKHIVSVYADGLHTFFYDSSFYSLSVPHFNILIHVVASKQHRQISVVSFFPASRLVGAALFIIPIDFALTDVLD